MPTSDVIIGLSSSDLTEGTVSPTSLTFTAADALVPRTVTVTGVDDTMVDGSVAYTIVTAPAVSGDSSYAGQDAADISVTNTDDEVAGILVSPTSGLVTTEAGATAAFTVVLRSTPGASVTIALSSSDLTEGTVSPASLTFTPADALIPKTVTVTGVDDLVADGNIAFTIVTAPAVSADPLYTGADAADVSATNNDDEAADLLFKDGFESGDLLRWSSSRNVGGRLAATAAAALDGAFGLSANVTDTNALYVQDDTPAAEPPLRARFSSTRTASCPDRAPAHDGTGVQRLPGCEHAASRSSCGAGSQYSIQAQAVLDSGTVVSTAFANITDARTRSSWIGGRHGGQRQRRLLQLWIDGGRRRWAGSTTTHAHRHGPARVRRTCSPRPRGPVLRPLRVAEDDLHRP